jgi:hypothetical protein
MDEQARDHVAKNEALFRHLNERVKDVDDASGVPPDELWDFLCECGDANCLERVSVTRSEYERVRSNSVYFAVVPGHENPEVERVVHEANRFAIVEKRPGEQAIAVERDPRG